MQALTFEIELLDPLLATRPDSGEPNSAVTYPFIPGSAIRGAIIRRFLARKTIALDDSNLQHLFFNGAICFLNAYLARPGTGARLLPTPLSWFCKKSEADLPNATVFDFAVKPQAWSEPAKPPRARFFWHESDMTQFGSPAIEVMVHNASSDRNRKKRGGSQVFRYDALAARQVFSTAIIAKDTYASLLEQLKPLIENRELRLGGSHTAGYGRVWIGKIELDPAWEEYAATTGTKKNDPVTLTCLSDVIVRGNGGQTGAALKDILGSEPEQAFFRLRVAGGFNRTWGLPVEQTWSFEAGSVFVFAAQHRATLEKFIETGIGERRAEGFGRIAIDLNRMGNFVSSELPRRKVVSPKTLALSPDSTGVARWMANRRWQSQLDEALARGISELTYGEHAFQNLPSPAQLMRAQLAARQAWHTGKLEYIRNHFRDLSRLSQEEWTNARLGDQRLLRDWIDQTLEDYALPVSAPRVAGVLAEDILLRDKMAARFIEGVLKQAAKRAKQEGKRK